MLVRHIFSMYPEAIYPSYFLLICMLMLSPIAHTEEQSNSQYDPARKYKSPEERREAGLGTQLNKWTKFSGLLEIEKEYFENNSVDNRKNRETVDTSFNVQWAMELTFSNWLGAELVYETDHDGQTLSGKWDEIFFFIELDKYNLGVEVGRVSAPFGEYYSNFVTDPILEFGETVRNGLIVDYTFFETIEVTGFIIDSDVEKRSNNTEFDWGASLEITNDLENLKFGLGYLSDIAESDEEFLIEEDNFYVDRVSALNAYLLFGINNFEFTAEYVQANNRFKEFERTEDKPSAYNIECVYYLDNTLQIAARYEGSNEYADAPKRQYGMSVSWRPIDRVNITADYLHGEYENDFVFDDEDQELDDRDLFSFQASIEF